MNRRVAALLLIASCVAGCGGGEGPETPSPLDGAACTVGTLVPGGAAAGAVTASSCVQFDEGFRRTVLADSWTLLTEPATAYIIRMDPTGASGALHLVAAARGEDGAAHFAGGSMGEFMEHDEPPTDDPSLEMLIPSTGRGELAIRVLVFDTLGIGAYELRVLACPLSTLSVGGLARRVDLTTSCRLNAPNFDTDTVRAVFFTLQADQAGSYHLDLIRRGGPGLLRGLIAGPGTDVGGWLPLGIWDPVGPDSSILRTVTLPTPGRYTVIVGSPADSNAVFEVGVSRPPTPAPDR